MASQAKYLDEYKIIMSSKSLHIQLTAAALKQLDSDDSALYVEMQTHLGCMPRKKVVFNQPQSHDNALKVSKRLFVNYISLVGGEACGIDSGPDSQQSHHNMIGSPRWLKIDYKNAQWTGEFGLTTRQ